MRHDTGDEPSVSRPNEVAVAGVAKMQRTREIGIRTALGATGRHILEMVFRQALLMVAIGLCIGIGTALALTRLIESMLFGVSGRDLLTMSVTACLLGGIGLCACLGPARRAARIDPIIALRTE
jgi:putative ABC transport system permease protein